MQWGIVVKDGIIVAVMEVVGVEGSRVLFERYLPLHDTVLKRYRVAMRNYAKRFSPRLSCGASSRNVNFILMYCQCVVPHKQVASFFIQIN